MGVVSYKATLKFKSLPENKTEIITSMEFRLPIGLFNDAEGMVEEMAITRITGNYDVLNSLLTAEAKSPTVSTA